jgi:hypothetical protein
MKSSRQPIAALCLGASLAWGAPALAQEVAPAPEPAPISWSYQDWGLVIGTSTVSGVAGMLGLPLLVWELFDLCPKGASPWECADENPISTVLVGVVGSGVGSSLGASLMGTGLGYDGDYTRSLTLGLVGGLCFATLLQPTAQIEFETLLLVGGLLTAVCAPMAASLGYYISQDNPARIGDSAALLRLDPGGTWSLQPPRPQVGLEGGRVLVPLVGGAW